MNMLFTNGVLSKALCLKKTGKEDDTSLFSIERDDEAKPEFMTCYKE